MRKVKIAFFCIKERKNYKVGDKYTGKRKDIEAFLEPKTKVSPITKKQKTK